MNILQILGVVVMGGLTIFSLMLLWAAWRQPAGGRGQKLAATAAGPASSRGWSLPVTALLWAAFAIEVSGMAIGLLGYRTKPLEPIHALYIVGAVALSAVVSLLVYVANQTRVARLTATSS